MKLPEDRDDLARHGFTPVEVGDGMTQIALRDEIIKDIRLPPGSLQNPEDMAKALATMKEAARQTQRTLKNMTKRLEDNLHQHQKQPFSAFCDELILLALGYAKTGDSDFVYHMKQITQLAQHPVFLSFPFLTVSLNTREAQRLLDATEVAFDISPQQLVLLKTAFRRLPLTEPLLRYFQVKNFISWGCKIIKDLSKNDNSPSVEEIAHILEDDFWNTSFGYVDLSPREHKSDTQMEGSNLEGVRYAYTELCCNGFLEMSAEGFADRLKFEETKKQLSLICGCEDCKKYNSDLDTSQRALIDATVEQLKGLLLGEFSD